MPFKRLHFEAETGEPIVIQPPPPKLGQLAAPAESLLADMRMATIWYAIMERDPEEARQKLLSIVRTDLHSDFPPGLEPPCVANIEEGKTQVEKERIRRALRTLSGVYARLVDRLVRFRPESRPYAFDNFRQELVDKGAVWRPFECSRFRQAPGVFETEGKKPRGKSAYQLCMSAEMKGKHYATREERQEAFKSAAEKCRAPANG